MHGYCLTSYSSQSKGVDCVFVAESSESFRTAGREQFYVSASRFKESLAIYTDNKRQLLEAVRKSSHRPAARDLVTKKIAEPIGEAPPKRSSRQVAVENVQKQIVKMFQPDWLRRRSIRQSHSKGIGV